MKAIFEKLLAGNHLTEQEMNQIMTACMQGKISDVQIAVFLTLMRVKGETVEELSSAAKVIMDWAHPINLGDNLVDIVGTGGDGKNTFNISTVSGIVASAAGAKVAKHGSVSVSSQSGSANLLEQAGIALELTDKQLQTCMQEYHFCFLYAPHFHKALRHAFKVRQELGIRSFFNLLGPLVNPANVKRQVIGVFDKRWQDPIAKVLSNFGSERALVVCSQDGLDEISIHGKTDVLEYKHGKFHSWIIDPKAYDLYHESIDAILVHSPKESLALAESVLQGETGAARDIVLLNTAAVLYCADLSADFEKAIALAAKTIDSGQALNRFNQLQMFTSRLLS